jgi:hypothetical protein
MLRESAVHSREFDLICEHERDIRGAAMMDGRQAELVVHMIVMRSVILTV